MPTRRSDRRHLLQLALAALPLAAIPARSGLAQATAEPSRAAGSIRDFDFFLGHWTVKHRRLRVRLANNHDWEEFQGTTTCQSLLGGLVNLNESVATREAGTFRGMGLRAFDARTGAWADWYLSVTDPTTLGVPGIGRFANRIGTFHSDETFEGRTVGVRGTFTPIRDGEAQWEQAFSPDAGKTWETNWVMRYSRVA